MLLIRFLRPLLTQHLIYNKTQHVSEAVHEEKLQQRQTPRLCLRLHQHQSSNALQREHEKQNQDNRDPLDFPVDRRGSAGRNSRGRGGSFRARV